MSKVALAAIFDVRAAELRDQFWEWLADQVLSGNVDEHASPVPHAIHEGDYHRQIGGRFLVIGGRSYCLDILRSSLLSAAVQAIKRECSEADILRNSQRKAEEEIRAEALKAALEESPPARVIKRRAQS